jgi:esterase/lipase superfamily enzyme
MKNNFLFILVCVVLSLLTFFFIFLACSSSKIQSSPTDKASKEISPNEDAVTKDSSSKNDSVTTNTVKIESTINKLESSSYSVVNIFYATDRNYIISSKPSEMYGDERSDLEYGFCNVSIPKNHQMGQLESPSMFKFQFSENPQNHIVLLKISRYDEQTFFKTLGSLIKYAKDKRAFVFIHGYNVTFNDAARRAAQMAFDLQFEGTPILYSWPSKGDELQYPADESNIEWTEYHLEKFLINLAIHTNFENIYLIAHSMGNRALTRVLTRIYTKIESSKYKEIILIAPDIDVGIFKTVLASKLINSGSRVTLYASASDKALKASQKYHAYPRLGDSSEDLVIIDGIETIDATNINSDFIGHSYYAENRSIISDLFYLFRDGKGAAHRFGLMPVNSKSGRYWVFRK